MLQVRIRHILGEKLIELPQRGPERPLIIGRAADADVQVPSFSVAPHHCALFVQDGRWVAQQLGGVTRHNGQVLGPPVAVKVGDILSLGSEARPPAVEIDPLGAIQGRSGEIWVQPPAWASKPVSPASKEEVGAPVPVARSPAPAPLVPSPPPPPPPPYVPPPPIPPEPVGTVPASAATPANSGDGIDYWGSTDFPNRISSPGYRRRSSGYGGMALAVLLAMLMLGAVWYYAYQHTRMMPSTVVVRTPFGPAVAPIPEQQTGQSHLPLHVFDLPGNQRPPGGRLPASRFATTSPTNQQAPIVAPSATQPASGDADSTEPPVAIDSAWDQVQAARFRTAKPGQAIIQYDEYRRLHPGQFAGQLDRYIDDAADLLWWQRIVQLCRERDRLTGDIKQHDQDLTAQTAGSFHETLVQEKKDLDAQRAQVLKTLTQEMGYKVQQPPDLENSAQLKELAKSRDPAKYADFKKRVLSYVRDHHGEVWWQGPG